MLRQRKLTYDDLENPNFVTHVAQEMSDGQIVIYTASDEIKELFIMLLSRSDSERIGELMERYKQTESNFVIL